MRPSIQILKLLREHQRLTRKQLADLTGLTNAGVSNAVKELLHVNVVREAGRIMENDWGRPTSILEINSEGGYVLGVAVKRTTIDLCLIDLMGRWIDGVSLANDFARCAETDPAPLEALLDSIQALIARQKNPHLLAAGFSTSSKLTEQRDQFATSNIIPLAQMNRLLDAVRRRFAVPVVPEYDIDASLLAEWWTLRHTHQRPNMIYVNDLLGFSLLIHGKRIPETMGCVRSLGPAHVDRSAVPMPPERAGCLETTASLSSMTDRLSGYVYGHRPRIPAEALAREIQVLFDRYHEGDPTVTAMFERGFDDLGFVLRNQSVLFHFDLVVLEGWTPRILADGIHRVQAVLSNADYALPPKNISVPPTVRAASLSDRQQTFGTALSAGEHWFASVANPPSRRKRRPVAAADVISRSTRELMKEEKMAAST
ncbi:MAG: ROK family transcriptional regulator [Phycisphaerales bacterium]